LSVEGSTVFFGLAAAPLAPAVDPSAVFLADVDSAGVETGSIERTSFGSTTALPGVYRPANLANLIEFQVIIGVRGRRA
jgi:hypothetical protein